MSLAAGALHPAALGFDIAGVNHSPRDILIYAVGWTIGWILLWRARPLPRSTAQSPRPAVAVIIPARNEATSLPSLLGPLVAQCRSGDRIIVIDDHSTDATALVAHGFNIDVASPPALPAGWLGKPHACAYGASITDQPVMVFLDADVRPGPTLLDDLAAHVSAAPDVLASMQPWHTMETVGEQPSILCNVTALMGCGAFTAWGNRGAATVAFGPVIAVDRATYERVGGHADETVRSMHTEDIGLARAVGRSQLYVGSPGTTTFRMYPGGFVELVRGWTRSIATGARFTTWWLALATAAWMCSVAGGWLALPVVYPLTALQVWVLGRRSGTIHPLAAALFPLLVVVFVGVFVRSTCAVILGRDVTWKGRQVDARTG
ncbi:MAG: 4,4'-diaponeurosporenoate glycosyltransferase [Ilumatobacter sp.]|jgi:4,4'-diaponeurosporenoate glycosyltransferase